MKLADEMYNNEEWYAVDQKRCRQVYGLYSYRSTRKLITFTLI